MPTDVARFFQTSAEGGHAGPGSTWDYIHLIEEPLAHWLRKARPASWVSVGPHELDAVLFPDIGDGVLLGARTVPPPRAKPANDTKARGSGELALPRRIEIARRLVAGETVEEIAGHCSMEAGVVLGCIRAIALALVDAGLADDEVLSTPSRQIDSIWCYRTWVAAAGRLKLAPVVKGIEQLLADDRGGADREVWNSWLRCLHGKDLRLDRSRPASVLLGFLVKAGIPRASLAVTAAQQALPLPPHLAEQRLVWRRCQPRPGVPKYRLALVARHVKASGGQARQVSVVGLHWLMLLAGSAILTKEK
jgi:hypothetical protein